MVAAHWARRPELPRDRHEPRPDRPRASSALPSAQALEVNLERVEQRLDLYPERLAGDAAYGSAEMLGWLVHDRGIEPHVPVFDNSKRADGTFSREEFTYEHQADIFICPAGKMLICKRTVVNATRFTGASH
jgi:hypothetical protein